MTKLHNVPLSAGQFHFSKQSNRLIAEASELRIGVGNHVESIKLWSPTYRARCLLSVRP